MKLPGFSGICVQFCIAVLLEGKLQEERRVMKTISLSQGQVVPEPIALMWDWGVSL